MDQLIIGRTFQQIPFVTLSYIIRSVLVTTAAMSNKQLASYLYFDPTRTIVKKEYWRIITNYLILPSAPDGIIFSNSIQFVRITASIMTFILFFIKDTSMFLELKSYSKLTSLFPTSVLCFYICYL